MEISPEVRELEAMAEAAKLPMSRVLAQAGVSLSTWWRWRNDGAEPMPRTARKVRAAIADLSDKAA